MNNNPREAVPVILERLKKTVSEWRHIQKNNSKSNNFVATTFAESFDHQSESFKLYSKSLYTSKALFKVLLLLLCAIFVICNLFFFISLFAFAFAFVFAKTNPPFRT